jgi:hypothetical protein
LVDASGALHRDRSFLLTRADFPTQHQTVFDAFKEAAQALANGTKAAKGASYRRAKVGVRWRRCARAMNWPAGRVMTRSSTGAGGKWDRRRTKAKKRPSFVIIETSEA